MSERFAAYTRVEVDERKKRLAIRVRAVEEHSVAHYRRAVITSLRETGAKPRAVISDDLSVALPRLAVVPIEQFLLEGTSVDGLKLTRAINELVAAEKVVSEDINGVTVYRLKDQS